MDPNAVYADMMEPGAGFDVRADAADALIAWLDRGGFPPDGVTARDARADAVAIRNAIW